MGIGNPEMQATGSWARQVLASGWRWEMLECKLLAARLSKSRQVGGDGQSWEAGPILQKISETSSSTSAVWGKNAYRRFGGGPTKKSFRSLVHTCARSGCFSGIRSPKTRPVSSLFPLPAFCLFPSSSTSAPFSLVRQSCFPVKFVKSK